MRIGHRLAKAQERPSGIGRQLYQRPHQKLLIIYPLGKHLLPKGLGTFGQAHHQRGLVVGNLGLLRSRFGNRAYAGKGLEGVNRYW